MKLNINALNKKAVKKSLPKNLTELSDESLNKVVGGLVFDDTIVACCCCYKYGSAVDGLVSVNP